MMESLYERSMRDGGDRAAVRVLAIAMAALIAPSAFAMFVPVDDVVRVDGVVAPEEVVRVQAADDAWVKLTDDLKGRSLAEGEALGSYRYDIETDRSRYEARRLQESFDTYAGIGRGSQLVVDDRDEKMLGFSAELDARQERLKPRPLVAPRAGVVLRAAVPPGEYTWLKKGDTILEMFRDDRVVLRARVPPPKTAELAIGMSATVENERTGERVPGRVRRVFFAADRDEGVTMLVDVESQGARRWKCGLPLVGRILVERKPLWVLLREIFVR